MSNEINDVVVEAEGLTKIFRDFWNRPKARAVNGIDFKVKRGQVFGLLGPNGSGKSTTVKMILGLLYPTRGVLKVFGEIPQNVEIKSRIGYLPEETYLYKYLTALETLDFYGALFGLSVKMRRERSEQLLNMVGLAHAFNRRVGEFSKGMARRIGLAQALVNDPDLVVLDEPTSGLDPIGCREVKDVIKLLASRGKTVILCSHLLADVQDVCDDMIVLYGGKVRASGALQDVLRKEDKTRMECPSLSQQTQDELKSWLISHGVADAGAIEIGNPVRNLEEYFLEVVRKAREQSVETAGARGGGEIPQYLVNSESGNTVLDALRRPNEVEKPVEKPVEGPKVDLSVLKSLEEKAAAPVKEEPAELDQTAIERREKANQALNDLLKK